MIQFMSQISQDTCLQQVCRHSTPCSGYITRESSLFQFKDEESEANNAIKKRRPPNSAVPSSLSRYVYRPVFRGQPYLHHKYRRHVRRRIPYVSICLNQVGAVLTSIVALTPFHRNAAGDFWTSTHARNIETMGYTYPELVNKPSNNTLKASIKSQYEDKNQTAAKTTKRQDESALTKGRVYLAGVKLALFAFADGEGSSQPYNVLVFLGDVPADPKGWSKADSFVGIASSLGGNNMVNERSTTVLVDLTTALAEQGVASDEAAAEYLKENLHWRLGLVSFT